VNVNIKSGPSHNLFCFILFSWNHKNKSATFLKMKGDSYPREVELKTIKKSFISTVPKVNEIL
jgi:hypothetical protein